MHRRDFLRTALAAAGGLAAGRGGLLTARSPDPWFADFHRALPEQPWLAGWRSFDEVALGEQRLAWQGRAPRGLAGTLYRNGPARFERNGQRYRHWFDGDGLVQAWRIDAQGASHRARMVGTSKFEVEQAAGRFRRQAAGTWIQDALPSRNADDANTANTSVLWHHGRLHALWEGGSAWELDPQTLASRGPRVWRDDLAAVPFSAHPLREPDGSLWNVGVAAYAATPTLLVWRIDATGDTVAVTPLAMSRRGYLHSFAMTARHLVFVLSPWLYDPEATGAFFERLRWQPEQGCEVFVVAKDALDAPRRYQIPGGLSFHYADAWEHGDELQVRACWVDDVPATQASLAGVMRGQRFQIPASARDPLVRLAIPLRGGEPRLHRDGPSQVEFPSWDERHGDRGGRVYLVQQRDPDAAYLDGIASWDARRDRLDAYRYGEGWLAEEHLFVPRTPGAARDRGWLVGTALDSRRGRLCLSVFDAGDLAAGPLCQAQLPRTLPLGFHGRFVPAAA